MHILKHQLLHSKKHHLGQMPAAVHDIGNTTRDTQDKKRPKILNKAGNKYRLHLRVATHRHNEPTHLIVAILDLLVSRYRARCKGRWRWARAKARGKDGGGRKRATRSAVSRFTFPPFPLGKFDLGANGLKR